MAVEIALSSWSSHLLVLMGTLLIGLGIFVLSGIIFAAKNAPEIENSGVNE